MNNVDPVENNHDSATTGQDDAGEQQTAVDNAGPNTADEFETPSSMRVSAANKLERQPFSSIRETMERIIGRSRRKADHFQQKENNRVNLAAIASATASTTGAAGASKNPAKTGATTSQPAANTTAASRKVQQTLSVETGKMSVADSFDDHMMEKVCAIPAGMDRNEWLATQTLSLFDHANAMCGTISDLCTPVTCPTMSYPGTLKGHWVDDRGKRHHYSAMRYIDSVMSFCDACRLNQSLFPTKFGCAFPPEFEPICRRVMRLLWHCLGHLYTKHWDHMAILGLRPQFSLILAHMIRVTKLYGLMDPKELAMLNNTLQMIRPSLMPGFTTAARPLKRLNSGDKVPVVQPGDSTSSTNTCHRGVEVGDIGRQEEQNSADGQLKPPPNTYTSHLTGHQRWDWNSLIVPSMKSGSWGGNTGSRHRQQLTIEASLLNELGPKSHAQTC